MRGGTAALGAGADSFARGLASLLAPSAIVCIDMPIGLSENGVRACDQAARRQLGPRASSVFPAPPRLALEEAAYADINSESKRRFGRGVSKQAFYLLPKIRELESILSRPEVRALNWMRPIQSSVSLR